jgi:hypothetical protein
MWERLDLTIADLEKTPGRGEGVAASFRQLLRAWDTDDVVAAWSATSAFSTRLRLLLRDLLSREPSWDSQGRYLEGLSDHEVLFQRPVRVRVPGVMVWGPRDLSRQSCEPFEADLEFTPDMCDVASYTVRFGDRRSFPDESFQDSLGRIPREIDGGLIEWAFVFHN